jgi:hypothetical protein
MIKRLKQWMNRRHAVASTSLLEREPTSAEAYSACMYWRHDFGLLPSHERKELMFEAELWLIAWKKVIEDGSNNRI